MEELQEIRVGLWWSQSGQNGHIQHIAMTLSCISNELKKLLLPRLGGSVG